MPHLVLFILSSQFSFANNSKGMQLLVQCILLHPALAVDHRFALNVELLLEMLCWSNTRTQR